jgi:PST family polysaccharide transporter/lipopolysaccharide exporter
LRRAIGRIIPSSGNIVEQTVKSGIWVSATNAADRIFQLLTLIILARLLEPADFGLMGIALLTLAALKMFSKLGISAALIQDREENVNHRLNTAWTMQFVRGATLAALLFVAAPFVAQSFDEPRATAVLRVIALSPLLMGFRNPGIVYFQKNLDFHKHFAYRISASIINFGVAVGYALLYPTVWALVFGYVAADATRLVVSYLAHGYRPWPEFELSTARELFDYGKWITASSVFYFLYSQGDDAVVGWLLTATALGFYQMAYRFSNAPATEITHTISSVMFPAYSKVQDDIAKLREGFFRAVQITTAVSFPMAFGIAAVTPTFVEAFLGPAWEPMVPTMQLLAAYGLLRSLGATFGPVWKALGRPDYITKLSALRVALIALLIYPLTMRFGIDGTALTIVAVYVFPMMPIDLYLIVRSVDTTYARLLKEVSYPFVASSLMALAVWVAQTRFEPQSPALEFGALVSLGIVVYVTIALVLMKQFNWGLGVNVESTIRSVT